MFTHMATGSLDEQAAGPSTAGELPAGRSVACEPLDPDDLFHSLQNERRRRVLRVLIGAEDETLAMGDISKSVAAAENECPERMVSSDERKRVYIALYQNHLPQLDDVGLIEYDQDRGHVSAGPALHQATTFLEMTEPADAPDERAVAGGEERDGERDDAHDADDLAGPFDRPLLSGATGGVGAMSSGGVAAVSVLAASAVWGGVLGATSALLAVLAVAVVAFVVAVARC